MKAYLVTGKDGKKLYLVNSAKSYTVASEFNFLCKILQAEPVGTFKSTIHRPAVDFSYLEKVYPEGLALLKEKKIKDFLSGLEGKVANQLHEVVFWLKGGEFLTEKDFLTNLKFLARRVWSYFGVLFEGSDRDIAQRLLSLAIPEVKHENKNVYLSRTTNLTGSRTEAAEVFTGDLSREELEYLNKKGELLYYRVVELKDDRLKALALKGFPVVSLNMVKGLVKHRLLDFLDRNLNIKFSFESLQSRLLPVLKEFRDAGIKISLFEERFKEFFRENFDELCSKDYPSNFAYLKSRLIDRLSEDELIKLAGDSAFVERVYSILTDILMKESTWDFPGRNINFFSFLRIFKDRYFRNIVNYIFTRGVYKDPVDGVKIFEKLFSEHTVRNLAVLKLVFDRFTERLLLMTGAREKGPFVYFHTSLSDPTIFTEEEGLIIPQWVKEKIFGISRMEGFFLGAALAGKIGEDEAFYLPSGFLTMAFKYSKAIADGDSDDLRDYFYVSSRVLEQVSKWTKPDFGIIIKVIDDRWKDRKTKRFFDYYERKIALQEFIKVVMEEVNIKHKEKQRNQYVTDLLKKKLRGAL